MADKEWYTLGELAKMFEVGYGKVRVAVQVLTKTNQIKTRQQPGDNRILEVHASSLDLVKQASL